MTSTLKPALADDVTKDDDLEYDLGNLMGCDGHPLDVSRYAKDPSGYLDSLTRDNTQRLFNQIFALEIEHHSQAGPLAVLPEPTTIIPRQKPLPKPKVETKWEKYAKDKGIFNKKRSRMIWDEDSAEWKPRHGYKRGKDNTNDWLIEYKAGENTSINKFEERKMEKKKRILNNKLAQMNNMERQYGRTRQNRIGAGALLSQKSIGNSSTPNHSSNNKRNNRIKYGFGKEGTSEALAKVQRSTASMGRFDKKLKNEKKMNSGGRRQAKRSNVDFSREREKSVLASVLGQDGAGTRIFSNAASSRGASETRDGKKRKKGKGSKKLKGKGMKSRAKNKKRKM
eukprot:g2015.t1